MADVTVLIPHKKGGRRDWLQDAIASIPVGVPYMVLENENELAEALNTGLREAKTEFVLRLDDDDLLDDASVGLLLDACWDVTVAYPNQTFVTEDLKAIYEMEPGEFCPNRLEVQNYITGAGSVFRRKAALEVGGFREMAALEDWDLWLRMARAGYQFKHHPDATYYYRQVEGSRNKMSEEVLADLRRTIVGTEKPLIASFYTQETVATNYWRCLLPSRYMPAQVIKHRPDVYVDDDGNIDFPVHRGSAVFQFPGHEYERYAMAAMQELGHKVLIETDDNYLTSIPYGKQWMRKMPTRAQANTIPSIELHRRIAAWVDGVIVTTEHLAKQYRKVTEAPVFVCPNQIEPGDWVTEAPMPDWYDPDKVYVGWAASASHLEDRKLVAQAAEWAAKQKNVELVLMGLLPGDWAHRFPRGSIRFIPWTTDLSTYRAMQRIIDIGLAPIAENAWSVCRSDLKALELGMSGAVPVLSEAIPYRGWTNGEMCMKARTGKDFLRAVQVLVKEPQLRSDLAAQLKEHILAERTVEGNAWRWQEAVNDEALELAA